MPEISPYIFILRFPILPHEFMRIKHTYYKYSGILNVTGNTQYSTFSLGLYVYFNMYMFVK